MSKQAEAITSSGQLISLTQKAQSTAINILMEYFIKYGASYETLRQCDMANDEAINVLGEIANLLTVSSNNLKFLNGIHGVWSGSSIRFTHNDIEYTVMLEIAVKGIIPAYIKFVDLDRKLIAFCTEHDKVVRNIKYLAIMQPAVL